MKKVGNHLQALNHSSRNMPNYLNGILVVVAAASRELESVCTVGIQDCSCSWILNATPPKAKDVKLSLKEFAPNTCRKRSLSFFIMKQSVSDIYLVQHRFNEGKNMSMSFPNTVHTSVVQHVLHETIMKACGLT